MYTAFSRDGPNKVYVQHLMKKHAKEISDLLERSAGGYFYVCGDAANMAREVNILLGQIFAQQRGITEAKGELEVKAMRSSNRYQEDVWS
jgi:NADPH-ferrihemoprotein reductase